MRLWLIPGMPARCSAFFEAAFPATPGPGTTHHQYSVYHLLAPPCRLAALVTAVEILTLSLCRSIFSRLSLATLRLARRDQE
ncbi:Uncharacterised protein [Escherichia coli]|nr:Uncharacterised protein [Escherichia coli]